MSFPSQEELLVEEQTNLVSAYNIPQAIELTEQELKREFETRPYIINGHHNYIRSAKEPNIVPIYYGVANPPKEQQNIRKLDPFSINQNVPQNTPSIEFEKKLENENAYNPYYNPFLVGNRYFDGAYTIRTRENDYEEENIKRILQTAKENDRVIERRKREEEEERERQLRRQRLFNRMRIHR